MRYGVDRYPYITAAWVHREHRQNGQTNFSLALHTETEHIVTAEFSSRTRTKTVAKLLRELADRLDHVPPKEKD